MLDFTMTEIQDIIETFELLGDWESRYQYLADLGERLEPLPDTYRTEAQRVKPCMSTVYVHARLGGDEGDRVQFQGDCDTAIIKGVLALLIRLMSGKTPREVLDLDIDALFAALRLHEHLSPTRHVGIFAIVEQMRGEAARLLAESS